MERCYKEASDSIAHGEEMLAKLEKRSEHKGDNVVFTLTLVSAKKNCGQFN